MAVKIGGYRVLARLARGIALSLVVGLGVAGSGCDACFDEHHPDEESSYRGEPSIIFCNERVSLSVEHIVCEGDDIETTDLKLFYNLKEITLTHVNMHGDLSSKLLSVRHISLNEMAVSDNFLAAADNVERLILVSVEMDINALGGLSSLTSVAIWKMPAPPVTIFMHLPRLQAVDLVYVPGGSALAENLHRQRPDIKLRVVGS